MNALKIVVKMKNRCKIHVLVCQTPRYLKRNYKMKPIRSNYSYRKEGDIIDKS